jgi:hypothetical protein
MGGGLLMSNINQPGNQSHTKILFQKIGSGGRTTQAHDCGGQQLPKKDLRETEKT